MQIRKAISEQVKLGKELSRKVIPKVTETVESENDEKRDGVDVDVFDSTNVWLTGEAKITNKSTAKESSSAQPDATLLDPSKVLAAIESDDEETEESMVNVIEEAFANDDVVEQFVKDKEDVSFIAEKVFFVRLDYLYFYRISMNNSQRRWI